MASSEAVTGKQACDLFTTLVVELQGLQPGARSVVNVLPDNQAPRAVNGQACSDGRYTGVQIESATLLEVDPTMIDLVRSALTHYHQGPL